MPCSLNIEEGPGWPGRVLNEKRPAPREQEDRTCHTYFTKMINNVKIASDSMNARPRTSSV